MIPRPRRSSLPSAPAPSVLLSLLGATTLLTGLTAGIAAGMDLGLPYYLTSLCLGGLVVLGVLVAASRFLPGDRFGCANGVTLARAMLICPLAGALVLAALDARLAWIFFVLALVAFLLDGVDGWVARRRRECSHFGARFDMETDALFVLVLSLLVLNAGKAGPWILLSGLLRYLFVLAGLAWAPLRAPLAPSLRRKAICALQVGALVICLAPIVPATWSAWLAAIALSALIASFVRDVSGLVRRAWERRQETLTRESRWLAFGQRATWLMPWLAVVAVLGGGLTPAPPAQAAAARYEIDPAHFSVGFLVHHIGYADTLGMFLEGSGSFTFDETAPAVSDIEVTIQADSVFTNHDRRDKHVKGGDFLDVDDHPEIRFVGREARQTGENTGEVTGDLTILGVTRPVTLQVTKNKIGDYPFGAGPPYVVGVSVRGTVKRSEFGMTYAVENGWVGDEVELIIEFEAIRQD
ncbi:MAG: YceI family protein [Kiloniellales bacterium]|nr:YceI family protein [Kiloniellales bacterium]